jgi:transposase
MWTVAVKSADQQARAMLFRTREMLKQLAASSSPESCPD